MEINTLFLFVITLLWITMIVVTGINIDLIRVKEGTKSTLFIMQFCVIIFSVTSAIVYANDLREEEFGEEVDFSLPIPFGQVILFFLSIFLIINSTYCINKYQTHYKNDKTIPSWKLNTFLFSNITLLILSLVTIVKGAHVIYKHINARVYKTTSSSSA